MERVLCSATVDVIHEVKTGEKGLNKYKVEVWGQKPHDYVRTYEIAMKSDNMAAQEGIRRFVDEMEALSDTSPRK